MKFGLILATNTNDQSLNNFAPIGLGCIAASIREHLPEVEVIMAETPEELIKKKPDVIGISSSTEFYHIAIEWASIFKLKLGSPIIIGGIHISLVPESMTGDFDVAVVGEGDITIVELLESMIHCKGISLEKLKKIKGLYFKDDRSSFSTPHRPLVQDLNTLPKINWHTLPYYQEGQGHIVSARGCPYKCSFCASQKFANQFRFYNAESIVDEIEYFIIEKGLGGITFFDDLFIANKDRLKYLINILKDRNLLGRCRFHGQVRANLITEETCTLLKKLNFITVGIGIESFSDKILKYYNKTGITSDTNQKAIDLLYKYGIQANPSIIFGAPIETKEDILVTLRALYNNFESGKITSVGWGLLRPYPGTAIWDHALKKNIVSNDMDWRKFTDWSKYELYLCEQVSPQELNELIDEWKTKYSLLNIDKIHLIKGNSFFENRADLFDNIMRYKGIFSANAHTENREIGNDLILSAKVRTDNQAILLDGWYEEENGNNRWIDSRAIGIFKTKGRGKCACKMFLPPDIFKNVYQGEFNLKFFNEGTLLFEKKITINDFPEGKISIKFDAPKDEVLILQIISDKSFIPNNISPDTPDKRKLAVMFLSLNID